MQAQDCCKEPACDTDPFYPFSLWSEYYSVSPAKFRTSEVEGEKISYSQWETTFFYIQPLSTSYGMIFGAGYIGADVNWKENPFFREKLFNYVSMTAGAYTNAFPDWDWNTLISVLIDTEEFSLTEYALYQWTLEGEYTFCDWMVFHGGFILEAGLSKEKIWPIVGFEFLPWDDWKINAIFPLNISVEYAVTPNFTAVAAVRFLRNRHRVKDSEIYPQAIFEYRSTGAEFELSYHPFTWLSVTGFAGSTFNGDFKITNRNNHDAQHFKFNGSFYAGGNLNLSF